MPLIVVASTNPVKMDAARQGFEKMFPRDAVSTLSGGLTQSPVLSIVEVKGAVFTEQFHFQSIDVPSGVRHQPMTDAETLTGARTRAENARAVWPDADFWIGIEGGVEDSDRGMYAFAWVVILGKDLTGEARTGMFQLPPEITRLVRQGVELGHADDIVFQRSNSKQKDGAIGILTDGLIDRTAYYEHAVMLALVPFKKWELYTGKQVDK